jgi:hypothetical protein
MQLRGGERRETQEPGLGLCGGHLRQDPGMSQTQASSIFCPRLGVLLWKKGTGEMGAAFRKVTGVCFSVLSVCFPQILQLCVLSRVPGQRNSDRGSLQDEDI